MSTTQRFPIHQPVLFAANGAVNVETLTAARTLLISDAQIQHLDPGGASRDVTLPSHVGLAGAFFEILNKADAAEDLVIKSAAAATIVTISQNERATVRCTGAAWVHCGIETIALS